MGAVVQQDNRRLLTKQIALFSSSHDGEVLAAVNAANKTLKSANITWLDIAATLNNEPTNLVDSHEAFQAGFSEGFQAGCNRQSPKDHHQILLALKRNEAKLNAWATVFVENIMSTYFDNGSNKRLTLKQCQCIEKLVEPAR